VKSFTAHYPKQHLFVKKTETNPEGEGVPAPERSRTLGSKNALSKGHKLEPKSVNWFRFSKVSGFKTLANCAKQAKAK